MTRFLKLPALLMLLAPFLLLTSCPTPSLTGTSIWTNPGSTASWSVVGNADFSAAATGALSLAIGPDNSPCVAYQDGSVNAATVMRFSNGSWASTGPSSDGAIDYPSLAFSPSGTLYFAFQDQFSGSNQATVMNLQTGAWSLVGSSRFSMGQASFVSLAIDSNGTPYVAYSDTNFSGMAVVRRFDGGSWVAVGAEGFSTGLAGYTSLAIDSKNTLYVAYADGAQDNKASLQEFNGYGWAYVGPAGFSAGAVSDVTLAIDPSGIPCVGYCDAGNWGKATVMRFLNGAWTSVGSAGFSAGAASYTSLLISPAGIPYIAYQDSSTSPVNKATALKFNGTAWMGVGSPGFTSNPADHIRLAMDSNGAPYAAFRDQSSLMANVMAFK